MKTNGFREIDFGKTECKNCGKYCRESSMLLSPIHAGKVAIITFNSMDILFTTNITFIDCHVCKGTGFIDESIITELELE